MTIITFAINSMKMLHHVLFNIYKELFKFCPIFHNFKQYNDTSFKCIIFHYCLQDNILHVKFFIQKLSVFFFNIQFFCSTVWKEIFY